MSYHKFGVHTINTSMVPQMDFAVPPGRALYNEAYLENYRQREATEIGRLLIDMRWDFVLRHVQPGRVLDWGGGAGGFARAGRSRGIACSIYDVNPGAETDFVPGREPLNGSAFDAITLWDVLEHIPRPAQLLADMRRLYLRDGGWVFVTTPAIEGCPRRVVEWRHYKPGEHLWAWSMQGLWALMEQQGFIPTEVNYAESRLRTGNGERNILGFAAHA